MHSYLYCSKGRKVWKEGDRLINHTLQLFINEGKLNNNRAGLVIKVDKIKKYCLQKYISI